MPFIAFEGLDGSGKSTLMNTLVRRLVDRGAQPVVTREPGGTPLGEEIRQQLLRTAGDTPVPMAEVFLYEAARAQHVERVIAPALARGEWVICDRFAASTHAFQVGGRGLDMAMIEALNTWATGRVIPDLYVLLDLSVDESRQRQATRGQVLDRFESEKDEFHERVRLAYLELARRESERWLILSAALSPHELEQKLFQALTERAWLE